MDDDEPRVGGGRRATHDMTTVGKLAPWFHCHRFNRNNPQLQLCCNAKLNFGPHACHAHSAAHNVRIYSSCCCVHTTCNPRARAHTMSSVWIPEDARFAAEDSATTCRHDSRKQQRTSVLMRQAWSIFMQISTSVLKSCTRQTEGRGQLVTAAGTTVFNSRVSRPWARGHARRGHNVQQGEVGLRHGAGAYLTS